MTTLLIVDDHPVVRTGLRAALSAGPPTGGRTAGAAAPVPSPGPIVVVGEAASGEEAVALAGHLHPDVVLCDLRLGDGIDGVETTLRLRAIDPAPAVLILTTFDTARDIVRAIEAGAAGYLLKDTDPDGIARAVTTVARGGTVLPPGVAGQMVRALNAPRLTARELEVVTLLATGASNHDIARALVVTEATVKSHLVRIFTKLDADSRSRAVARARDLGIV